VGSDEDSPPSLVSPLLFFFSGCKLGGNVLCAKSVILRVDEALHEVIGVAEEFIVITDEVNQSL
jgi:hypothetical protein